MTPAEHLLRKVTRIVIDEETKRAILGVLDQSVDWMELERKAAKVGIGAMAYHGLKEAGLSSSVPPEVWGRLRRAYLANSIRNSVFIREASIVIKDMARDSIPVIALKGTALVACVYPTPAMRQMSDVDLLVHSENAERAYSIMLRNGFVLTDNGELDHEYAGEFVRPTSAHDEGQGVMVDLHRELVPEKAPFTFDIDAIWDRSVTVKIGDAEAKALSTEDAMHHLAVHLFHHHFAPAPKWKGICDLGAILQNPGSRPIDWDYLLRSSRSYKTTGALYLALSALEGSLKTTEVCEFLNASRSVIRSLGMGGVVDALSRYLLRSEYNTLSLLPSAIVDITEESSILGKVRTAFAYLNSTRRRVANHGLDELRSAGQHPFWALRSLSVLTKHNLNSIRIAYLIGKTTKETRDRHHQWEEAAREDN